MKKVLLSLAVVGLFFAFIPYPGDTPNNEAADAVQPTKNVTLEAPQEGEVWLESLITATPQEGRDLAIKMARKTIGAIQGNADVKKKLRASYSENAEDLILSAQVVATEFQTVAAANNYWRK